MDGAWNMACDVTLMSAARERGAATLRTYGWLQPTISFGRHERAHERYTARMIEDAGWDAVRRPTGGRALLHSREVTYSVAFPLANIVPWRTAYAAVNRILLEAMEKLGVTEARIAPREEAELSVNAREGSPCFAGVAEGEVSVNGQKLVASAIWRERGAYLQHGSILLFDDQGDLGCLPLLTRPAPAASLSALLGSAPATETVAAALETALARHAEVTGGSLAPDDLAELAGVREQFLQSSWLWRR
jgi:lipoate-protein ligase A